MAEKADLVSGSGDNSQSGKESLECSICLQPCLHPVELPCGHIFCYLCIKGVAMQRQNGRCALCRANIPSHVLTNPALKDVTQLYKEPQLANGYKWYYESRNGGWWQYDERSMIELEREFSQNKPSCQLLIAGQVFIVDFALMTQYRQNDINVTRAVRREQNLNKRGVAGLELQNGANNNVGAGSSGNGSNNSTVANGSAHTVPLLSMPLVVNQIVASSDSDSEDETEEGETESEDGQIESDSGSDIDEDMSTCTN